MGAETVTLWSALIGLTMVWRCGIDYCRRLGDCCTDCVSKCCGTGSTKKRKKVTVANPRLSDDEGAGFTKKA
eukprot:CAMPEP_0178440578 /NCGR_PEP_ID=MMETSP0689_2-20121128/36869_1 /TAXON_ID=160604 /ORGANISM="Amphidinium massartii, Strain CS-259" /LENGTH=71 /DNA_ID=CAMNT_0020063393 /DNA_START=20 /DNA_END=235 /DNA_ORIENTATION=+